MDAGAIAQNAPAALPDITVTAPSPIVRRKPAVARAPARVARATPGRTRGPAPQAQPAPAPPAPAPQQGVLPVVTDQFATVTVVPNEEIRRQGGATLGDLLFSKPGITGSSFAPGASSRPIIRGLDVNRVGIVENGVSSNGASDLGEDHFVPIDPLSTNQVEVIRGPATLRYGSTAIGGVVSATNNRIPDALPSCAAAPFQTYGLPAKAPLANVRIAGLRHRRNADGGQLGRPRRRRRHPARCRRRQFCRPRRRLRPQVRRLQYSELSVSVSTRPCRSTAASRIPRRRPDGASIGGSYIFDGGFIGAAITQNNTLYHIPGIDGAEHLTRIDARQTKFTTKGEYRPDAAAIEAVRFWAGATDYKHNEIGLADPADLTTLGVRQTFTNKEQEGRVEVQFAPFNVRFAALTTAVGVQAVASATDRAEPRRSRQPDQRIVRSEQEHQGRRIYLQRIEVQRHHQGADCRAHRERQSERNDAGVRP